MARPARDPAASLSWAAHDLEPYLARVKLGRVASISLPFCLLGSYDPDIFTKWAVYGLGFAHHDALVSDPIRFHRGWPGVGFTHTPFAALVLTLLIYGLTRSRLWAGSFLFGAVMHILSDTLDSVGVMLAFPFSTWHLHFGVWEYVGQQGRRTDAIAYNLSLGGVWDLFWVACLLLCIGSLSTRNFRERIATADPIWPWLIRRTNETVALAAFRTSAFFGIVSPIAWIAWALLVNRFHAHWDPSLGGPQWAPRVGPH